MSITTHSTQVRGCEQADRYLAEMAEALNRRGVRWPAEPVVAEQPADPDEPDR